MKKNKHEKFSILRKFVLSKKQAQALKGGNEDPPVATLGTIKLDGGG